MAVGRSSRTPFKHWVLNSHLGQICGVLAKGNAKCPAKPNPFLCVDLCAGDGTDLVEQDRSILFPECDPNKKQKSTCSPGIISHHCDWLAKQGFRAQSVMIEKHSATFESLEQNMSLKPCLHSRTLRNDDARNFVFQPSAENQAVFINCDPNSIADLPFSERLAKSLTKTTTITLTLGCNVGGLKRLTKEKRQEWYDYMNVMIQIMPSWHDAILISIERDDAQWAYFSRIPQVWSESSMVNIKKTGSLFFENGVRVESYRKGRAGFRSLVNHLFLTKAELKNA